MFLGPCLPPKIVPSDDHPTIAEEKEHTHDSETTFTETTLLAAVPKHDSEVKRTEDMPLLGVVPAGK
jgi:hypothetical protein